MTTNPYQAAAPVESDGSVRPAGALRVGDMLGFAFTSPNWMMNVLWGSLAMLTSSLIVPQIIYSGYLWEVVEELHRKKSKTAPDFDLQRMGDYLMRGLWPLLVGLIVTMVLSIVLLPLTLGATIFAAVTGAGEDNAAPGIGLLILWLLLIGFSLVAQLALQPLMLRAALSQDLAAAFDFRWVRQFIALTWKEMLIAGVVLTVAGTLAFFIGLGILCVGVYPAIVIMLFATTHAHWQLYELFLQRGGTPIPLKPAPAPR